MASNRAHLLVLDDKISGSTRARKIGSFHLNPEEAHFEFFKWKPFLSSRAHPVRQTALPAEACLPKPALSARRHLTSQKK